MDPGRSIRTSKTAHHRSNSEHRRTPSRSPLVEQALVEQTLVDDLPAFPENKTSSTGNGSSSDPSFPGHGHGLARCPSGAAGGTSRPVFNQQPIPETIASPLDRKLSREAEQSLLRDNHVLPPKHDVEKKSQSLVARIYRRLFSTKLPPRDIEDEPTTPGQSTERDPLLCGINGRANGATANSGSANDFLEEQWEEAVISGRIRTTWQREAKTIMAYSTPLITAFFLQYFITVTSVLTVGRLGKMELGAVSLAYISSTITCLTPFQGLATSLDTLCAQAYGSGYKHLVGLQCQRMTLFLLFLSLPVAVLWMFSESILVHIVPDPESARLAALYLKVSIFSVPGIVIFETGKRFLQAQGLFRAIAYILLIASPINVFMHWLLVWKVSLGFVGAPIAATITQNLLPVLLVLYVKFVDGTQCWGGFTKRAFHNWGIISRLALPGMIMVEAEWLAFEIITLFASRFGTEYLAAQSVLSTLTSISYQIPFPLSIAASTRVANLIGAGLVDAAKTSAKVAFVATCIVVLFNFTIYSTLRYHLPLLFTNDEDVIALVAKTLPLVAVVQVFDGISSGAHGLLRGIGKQFIGGPVNLIAYYGISLPISLSLAFWADWKLDGMWAGVAVGLIVVSVVEYTYILKTDWHKAAAEVEVRNAAG